MKFLYLLEQDKANHFIYGLLIYAAVNYFFGPMIAFYVLTVVAFGKEIYDWKYGTGFSGTDIVFTIIGGMISFLISTF